jgi:hypothetical protein
MTIEETNMLGIYESKTVRKIYGHFKVDNDGE